MFQLNCPYERKLQYSGHDRLQSCSQKFMRSQLVLGTLQIAGISPELYKVDDHASDFIVLKLCGSNTIDKLLKLIETMEVKVL